MTQEDKKLLYKDLAARLPYKVKVKSSRRTIVMALTLDIINDFYLGCDVKPYLRSISTMTEMEYLQLDNIMNKRFGEALDLDISGRFENNDNQKEVKAIEVLGCSEAIDYLNSIHIDYRGLIEKGLALPAPEGMYE